MGKFRGVVYLLFISFITAIGLSSPAAAEDLTIASNYTLVSSKRVNLNEFDYIYRASMTNTGPAVINVSASVATSSTYIKILQPNLTFGNVPESSTVTSSNTFTVRHDRRGPFDTTKLIWSIQSTPAQVAVPDVRGMLQVDAATALNSVRLVVGTITMEESATIPAGQVIRQDPIPGTIVFLNTKINLFVSLGPLKARFDAIPTSGNAPLKVTFSPNVITTSAINYYDWDLDGNGTFEIRDTVGRNQSYTYTMPGEYHPALKVTDSNNRTDTQTVTITAINTPPVVTASAQPSNGQVPLTVAFSASATDNEGIATYEWDFEGDGVYDLSSTTTGNASRTYTIVGTYTPRLRVTDKMGASTVYSVPATEVQAAPVGSPTITLNANPSTGNAPLAISFSSTINNNGGSAIVKYEIDFNGDGTYDFTSTTTGSSSYSYTAAGTYFPRLRVTNAAGFSSTDSIQITVKQNVSLSVSTDTIDTAAGGTVTINTTLGAATNAGIIIEKRGGALARTLVPVGQRNAGTYNDIWDGKDDSGAFVAEGDYYAVLLYEFAGAMQRYDLALTTGGTQYNPPRSSIASSFSPFANSPMIVDITLAKASEVDAFIGRFNVNTRLVTLLQRVPLGKGTYRVTWNGDDGAGQMLQPPSGDSFLFGLWGYYLANNAIYVRSGAHVTGLSVSPSIFDPTGVVTNLSTSTFTLNKSATIELVVTDMDAGKEVARLQYPGIQAGNPTSITWDGKGNDGILLAPGRYRLGLTAIDDSGYKSLTVYALQRVYY
ncbi:MAG: PKD domain-containing protein [Pedobacter sp.]